MGEFYQTTAMVTKSENTGRQPVAPRAPKARESISNPEASRVIDTEGKVSLPRSTPKDLKVSSSPIKLERASRKTLESSAGSLQTLAWESCNELQILLSQKFPTCEIKVSPLLLENNA